MIVGPLVPTGAVEVMIAVAVACLTTRWVAPLVLRTLAKSIQAAVVVVAAVAILPEYYLSTDSRRRHRNPPQLAYDYGAAVGWVASLIHRVVGALLHGVARAIRAIPMVLVAVVAAVLTAGRLLGLI
jgi:energy-coupling factor transporter transmembrane protein EcfT